MRHFEWRWVIKFGDVEAQLSLLEINELGGSKFWATLKPISDDPNEILWTPIMINKYRNGYVTIKETLILEDLKECVEKNLIDEGISQDGDYIEDYTV